MGTGSHAEFLAVNVQVTAGVVTVVISGDLDIATAPSLTAHLRPTMDGRPQRLVFDMAGVGFIDCATARLIAGTARSLPPGRRPVLRSPSPLVRRVLELTGLARRFEIEG